MPDLTIAISDDGKIGTLPEPLQKFLDAKIDDAYGRGKAKGAEAAANPAELERVKTLEMENSKLREAEAKARNDYAEAERLRTERHLREIQDRDEKLAAAEQAIQARTERVRQLTAKDIRAAALEHGARRESLDELEQLLMGHIGLDDSLQPFVKDQTGKAKADKDGQPVTIGAYVQEYLAAKPHHKVAPAGRGGGMTGGRSMSGEPVSGIEAEKAAALDETAKNPTLANITRVVAQIGKSRAS